MNRPVRSPRVLHGPTTLCAEGPSTTCRTRRKPRPSRGDLANGKQELQLLADAEWSSTEGAVHWAAPSPMPMTAHATTSLPDRTSTASSRTWRGTRNPGSVAIVSGRNVDPGDRGLYSNISRLMVDHRVAICFPLHPLESPSVIWSTGPAGDPRAVAHAMPKDAHGRVDTPVCGRTTHGLWLRAHTDWENVPTGRRCRSCDLSPDAQERPQPKPGPLS